MPGIYEGVLALKPRRSAFNLSYSKSFTCDLGQLIPVMCDEVVPGDSFTIGAEVVVRFQPMVTPVLHEVNCFVHYFFVPYRLLDDEWEDFITGGELGTDASTMDRWTPTGGNVTNDDGTVLADNAVGSLWDYLGLPTGVIPTGATPLCFPKRAYNLVWNQYYRDETAQVEISLDSAVVKNRAWEKDFFTSALPWQQRGTAPALPISGSSSAVWATPGPFAQDSGVVNVAINSTVGDNKLHINNATGINNARAALNTNTVDLGVATTFDVADLRLAFQIQKWMERNARGGARYTEWLQSHFGVAPKDERLSRAEYIGGTRMPVIVSEVLQTSQTDPAGTPQGTMAGHGLGVGRDFCGKYYATEFGCIIGIMSIMPKPAYFQGIPRQWLRTTKYDWYSPEWAHLSEQAVIRAELYANGVTGDNNTVFGYQGRFNEMRSKQNMVCGLMRPGVASSLGDYWNMVREFAAAPELNETFIRCVPRKEWLAVPTEPACLVHFANKIKAVRPLPIEAAPGLIDHA